MKSMIRLVVILLAGTLMVSCGKDNGGTTTDPLNDHELKVLSQGNRFGFDLFAAVVAEKPGENICVSPYSVYTALAMTANGAASQTLDEILGLLGFSGKEITDLDESVQNLDKVLINKDPATVFETANSVWYNTNDFEVYPGFTQKMEDYFSATVEGLDFNAEEALPTVNGWVKAKTHDKIDRIINRINPDDVCFLINALYFNGKWTTVFDKKQTQLMTFTPAGQAPIQVTTMYLHDTVEFISNSSLTAARLPYGDGSWCMYLFMPPAGTDIDGWCGEVLANQWGELRDQFSAIPGMELYLPQFKMETSLELSDALKELGMPTAFSGAADFSNLGPGSLAISQVLHKTYIDVNEEGTEAAAVTAVIITRTSFPISDIRFNRPFVFVIAEKNTGAILFVGKLMKP